MKLSTDRRQFLALAGGTLVSRRWVLQIPPARFKAVAFDALALFDTRPIAALAESFFAERGAALMTAWRARQFDYQWLRTLAHHYESFPRATHDALIAAARQSGLEMTTRQEHQLMIAWLNLSTWPDVAQTIETLRAAGLRLVVSSNMTTAMLELALERAGLTSKFEALLSTDIIKSYKPAPEAYQMIIDALRLKREKVLFVASAGWDVAGAKWFGYTTCWANRLGGAPEELDANADATGPDLTHVARFALA